MDKATKEICDRLDSIDKNLENHMHRTALLEETVNHNRKMEKEEIETIKNLHLSHSNKIITRLIVAIAVSTAAISVVEKLITG